MNRTKQPSLWQIALFNVAAILLILYSFECVLYFTNPKRNLPFHGVIGDTFWTWGYPTRINSFGFREREFKIPKPANTYRIMVLGDSLTFGDGVDEPERFTNILEGLLKKKFPKRQIEVLNFGVCGGSIREEWNILETNKNRVKPDLIVLGFCLNDPQPGLMDYSPERYALREKYKPFKKILRSLEMPHLAQTLGNSLEKIGEKMGRVPTWWQFLDRSYDPQSVDWKDFENKLVGIRSVSDQEGLPQPIFALLTQGVYTERPTDYKNTDEMTRLYSKWYDQAEMAAKKAGFRTIDFRASVIEQLPSTILAINKIDAHAPPALHALYAEGLFNLIGEDIFKREN